MHRGFVVLGSLALTILLVLPARAQFGGFKVKIKTPKVEIKTPNADKRLGDAEREFRAGLDGLPRTYGNAPDKEAASIAKAEKHLAAGRDILTADLKLAGRYDAVDARRRDLEVAIVQAKAQLACGRAWAAILETHKTGQAAPDDQLDALDRATAAFVKGAPPKGYESQAKWWKREAKRLREKNPEIAKAAKEDADRERRRALAEKKKKAFGAIDGMVKTLRQVTFKGEEVIGADALAAFVKAMDGVKAVHEPALAYYRREQKDFAYYNAWFAADPPQQTSRVLGGEVVASGESSGHKLKVNIKASKGACYLLAARWRGWTGGEKFENGKWKPKRSKGHTRMQRFQIWRSGWKWGTFAGFCATDNLSAGWSADLTFAGTKNGVRYVVLSWSKKDFPVWVASQLRLLSGDRCDTRHWVDLWLNPVPGTLVWSGKEPFLLSDPGGRDGAWTTLLNLSGGETRILRKNLSGQPPAARAIKTQFYFRGCPGAGATDADAVKLYRCNQAVDKKYEPLYDKWEKKKKYAKAIGTYRKAQRKLDNLPDQQSDERARKCGPIRARIARRWEKTFNKLVDTFVDSAPKPLLDLPAIWAAYREAEY